MSYDITLVRRHPDQPWVEALEAAEPGAVAEPDNRAIDIARLERIHARVREVIDPWDLVPCPPDDQCIGELTHATTGIEVSLFPGSAAVAFPYWEHADPAEFQRVVSRVVGIVADETGYAAYDPQTDAEFDGSISDRVGLAAARQLGGVGGPAPARRDWYLPVGIVVTMLALVLYARGEGGGFAAVALALGLVDIAVGITRRRRQA